MADTQVKILITAIDDASRVFRDVLDNSDSMASKLMSAGDTFESMGSAVKDFTRPLSRGLNASKDAAIGFESEMAEVAKTTGFSAKQVAQVGAVTKQLSREIPMTVSGLNNIAVAAGQSGIALKDTKGFIKDVSKAATAFYAGGSAKEMEQGAEKAALAFGKLTNVFGIPIRDVNTLAAAINVLGDSSIASEKDILNAMTRTAGLGVQAKMSAKDLAALNASMISLGMAPSVAATATNALLSRLTTAEIQSARFQKGLEMIGISASEMQNLVQSGGNNAIFALSNALDKLDPVNRAKAIGQMFGAEHSDNVGIFLERINVYKDLLGSVANDQSNLNRYNKVFEAQLNTTASQLQILNNSFKELAIEIGTALLPAVRAFVKFLTPIIHGITAFVKKHPWLVRIGAALVGIAAAAGSALLAMAALSKIWGGFSAAIPVLQNLSNQFLGVGHPISKMLNWLAKANQRLLGFGKTSDKVKPLSEMQMGKLPKLEECLPVCICPEICEGFEARLKLLVSKLDFCIPICICPEICAEGKIPDTGKGKPKTEMGSPLKRLVPIPTLPSAKSAEVVEGLESPVSIPAVVPAKKETEKELEKEKEETKTPAKKPLGIPQIIALTTALVATTSAINKLQSSNSNLADKILGVGSAIGAGLAAKELLKPAKAPTEVPGQVPATPAKVPVEIPGALPATAPAAVPSPVELATQTALVQQQAAEKLGITQLDIAEKLSTKKLQESQQLAAVTQANQAAEITNVEKLSATRLLEATKLAEITKANQAAEIATADKIAAGKLLAQQASNQLATQQLQTQLAAQKVSAALEIQKTRSITQQQVAATATQSMMAAATKTHTAVTDTAGAQQVGIQQNIAAQQVAATQLKADADRRQAQEEAAQKAAIAAEEKKQEAARIAAEKKAEEDRNFVPLADSEGPTPSELRSQPQSQSRSQPAQRSGGGFFKNAALLGAGALGIGGLAFAATKAVGAITGAVSGGVGAIANAAKGAASALSMNAAKGAATLGATASKIVGGAGSAIGGAAKAGTSAISGAVSGAGAAIAKTGPIGSAITKTIGGAASSAGSAIGGAAAKVGGTIGNAVGAAKMGAGLAGGAIKGAAGSALSAAGSAAKGAASSALNAAGSAAKSAASSALSAAGSAAKSAGSAALSGAGNLAKGAASGLLAKVGGTAGLTKAAVSAAPIASAAAGIAAGSEKAMPTNTISKFTRSAETTAASDLAAQSAEAAKNTISPFKRSEAKEETKAVSDLATKSAEAAKNNIVPLVRSSKESGKAIVGELAKGIEESKPKAELAAAGLAKSVSSYLPRSPAEKGPLSDLDQTGFGLTQEFIKGIDGSAIQNKFEEVMNPPSKFAGVDMGGSGGNSSTNAVYSPTYNLSGTPPENFIAELEKHDRKFIEWLQQTQERFNRGRY